MLTCIGLVIGFQSSSNMAAAYGIAVTTTMVITTLLLAAVARHIWGWSRLATGLLLAFFLSIDVAFFGANLLKIPHGGWFPLVAAAVVFIFMTTWRQGRQLLAQRLAREARSIERLPAGRGDASPTTGARHGGVHVEVSRQNTRRPAPRISGTTEYYMHASCCSPWSLKIFRTCRWRSGSHSHSPATNFIAWSSTMASWKPLMSLSPSPRPKPWGWYYSQRRRPTSLAVRRCLLPPNQAWRSGVKNCSR